MKRNNSIGKRLKGIHLSGKKAVALLVDPDKFENRQRLKEVLAQAKHCPLEMILVGGSLMTTRKLSYTIRSIREMIGPIPIVLFPGNVIQLSGKADGILFLSLISGRNPELLIGQQVVAAPLLAKTNLEILPTGYMLVDGGVITSAHYMSQSVPLPNDKPELAVATALAGHYLGLGYFYLDTGSGATHAVSSKLIKAISNRIDSPLLVGGGIDTIEKAKAAWQAGADIVVIGSRAEKNPDFLIEVLQYSEMYNLSLNVN
ncbi:MAG TPA: phosphoglycerol geranylgeranyltransferase [Lunatimonas sp.]|nr:phosphoglycerol geranylgeranyltransferase [Lunatimonas sp.]